MITYQITRKDAAQETLQFTKQNYQKIETSEKQTHRLLNTLSILRDQSLIAQTKVHLEKEKYIHKTLAVM